MVPHYHSHRWMFLGICVGLLFVSANAKAAHKVYCTESSMKVEISISPDTAPQIYLEGMKGYPNEKCQPTIEGSLAVINLSLDDIHECGVTRVVNKVTGKKTYYHKLIVETESSKELVSFKCITTGPTYNIASEHDVVKRDVLPEGFQEEAPEELEITSLTKKAPEPVLGVGVRQGDSLVTGELNVSPGTLLAMEVFLDKSVNGSADVYGIGVSHMQVTDTKSQEETIIFNGCSVDPYLFENFNTVDGDFLTAKFRAFKFPDSTYVQFRGTVNVCLDKCKGIQCSNGQVGYGRRRREIADNNDPNKIYEISMTTFIKVETDESEDQMELEEKLKQLKVINQKLARNSRGSSVFESVHDQKMVPMENDDAVVEETTRIRSPGTVTVNAAYSLSSVTAIFTVMSVLLLKLFL